MLSKNPGSFRDPANQVYQVTDQANSNKNRIFRGLNSASFQHYQRLAAQEFFKTFIDEGKIPKTDVLSTDDPYYDEILKDGWAGVLEHDEVPFISYPYEWTFSMLKDAALLHLALLEESLEHGWILKDSSAFNIQWRGSKPVFIDIASFEPWATETPWTGYRQFCSMFLIPLMLKAHRNINFSPLLRSNIDGIQPIEANNFFSIFDIFKAGVTSHVLLPAFVEKKLELSERNDTPVSSPKNRKFKKSMVIGLVQSMRRLVSSLNVKPENSNWSNYDNTHTYQDPDLEKKLNFVKQCAQTLNPNLTWDIGCNTGIFSKAISQFSNNIISIDSDHNSVEKLYLDQRSIGNLNTLPLVIDLANMSPNQGWASKERLSIDSRKKPDLVLCLALVHHICISSNIPLNLFFDWLSLLKCHVVIEFVDRDDAMVQKLLLKKSETYESYTKIEFMKCAQKHFNIQENVEVKEGKRIIYFLAPKKY